MRRIGQLKRLKSKLNFQRCTTIILLIVCAGLYMRSEMLSKQTEQYKKETIEATEKLNGQNQLVADLKATINELDSQLKLVEEVNHSYVDELTELRSRSELYDKYSYAVIDECGNRTELKYAEIKLGEQLMLEKGYDPHLMFASIMVESRGKEDLVNKKSGATGYGQFLDSTAKYVYTNLMGKSGYYSDIRKDGETNIRMMAVYYDYLYKLKKGSTFKVIKYYSGNSTDAGTQKYIDKLNYFAGKVGVVIQ